MGFRNIQEKLENLFFIKFLFFQKRIIYFFLFFQVLNAIKLRVNTARKLDKLMLDDRKETVEKNWLQKAAEEADLVIFFPKNISSNLLIFKKYVEILIF